MADQAIVAGSRSTIGSPPFSTASTSASFPGFASRATNNAVLTIRLLVPRLLSLVPRAPGLVTGAAHPTARRAWHDARPEPPCAQQFDGAHDLPVRQGADAHLRQVALVAEDFVLEQDLVDHFLRAAHPSAPRARAHGLELRRGRWGPAAFLADLGHHRGVGRKELVRRLLRRFGYVAVRVDPERQLSPGRGRPASPTHGRCRPASAKRSGMPPMIASAIGSPSSPARTADAAFLRPRPRSGSDPGRTGVHAEVVERRPVHAGPRHPFRFGSFNSSSSFSANSASYAFRS